MQSCSGLLRIRVAAGMTRLGFNLRGIAIHMCVIRNRKVVLSCPRVMFDHGMVGCMLGLCSLLVAGRVVGRPDSSISMKMSPMVQFDPELKSSKRVPSGISGIRAAQGHKACDKLRRWRQ